MKLFWIDEEVGFPGLLQGVISILPTHKMEQLKADELFRRQVLYADLVLMNHQDKVKSPEEQAKAEEELKKMNPMALTHKTENALIDLELIFNLKGFNSQDFLEKKVIPEKNIHASHDISFNLIEFGQVEFNGDSLEYHLGLVLWGETELKGEILRLKGNVRVKDSEFLHHIQG